MRLTTILPIGASMVIPGQDRMSSPIVFISDIITNYPNITFPYVKTDIGALLDEDSMFKIF